ncbi:MAG: ABC transporter permease [Clostridia bacterium]|nr:ABC transporter permease [Clostridia bacterium]MBR5380246.1 ABC transporter permease [Clostridia bacterium]MBR5750905.1 ABC transporter permease [Clostridia bacterium]
MQPRHTRLKEPLVHLTKRETPGFAASMLIRVAAFVLGMLVCGLVAFLLVGKLQKEPGRIWEFYNCFIKGSFSTERKLWSFLKNIAVLLCIALALTPAFRMRFWNIGAEGQTLMGVLAAIAVNFYLGGKYNPAVRWPEWSLLVLMLAAALLAGAVWGLIPALFKAVWNTNETLFTLMMNYVATFLVSYCLIKWVPSGSSSLGKLSSGKFPTVFTGLSKPAYSDYLVIILIVLAATALIYIYLNYTKHGYEISVVGESVRTARYVGISVKKVIIRTMIVSGLLCGLAGYLIGAGLDRSVTTDSVGGQGFTAIMVAWLAKFDPLMMILTAGVIIFLNQGADQISTSFEISGALPNVIIGIVLFFIIGSEFFINYKLNFRKREPKEAVR